MPNNVHFLVIGEKIRGLNPHDKAKLLAGDKETTKEFTRGEPFNAEDVNGFLCHDGDQDEDNTSG